MGCNGCGKKDQRAAMVNAYLARQYSVPGDVLSAPTALDQCRAVIDKYFGDRPFTYVPNPFISFLDNVSNATASDEKADFVFVPHAIEFKEMSDNLAKALKSLNPGGVLFGVGYGSNVSVTVSVSKLAEKDQRVMRGGGCWWVKQ